MEKKSNPKSPTQNPTQPTVNANASDGVMDAPTVSSNHKLFGQRMFVFIQPLL